MLNYLFIGHSTAGVNTAGADMWNNREASSADTEHINKHNTTSSSTRDRRCNQFVTDNDRNTLIGASSSMKRNHVAVGNVRKRKLADLGMDTSMPGGARRKFSIDEYGN